MELYENGGTRLQVKGELSDRIPIKRGVRQGDPLSPLLFNLVVDTALRGLPAEVGFSVSPEIRVGALAFADDVVLAASTGRGLQLSIDRFATQLGVCGLSVNPGKSSTISIVPVAKVKKTKIVEGDFRVGGEKLASRGIAETWRYLGVDFVGAAVGSSVKTDLRRGLERIGRAPLKPQQRLRLLTVYLLPRLNYGLTFGRTTKGKLKKADQAVRAAVRGWLQLPHDAPVGYFHAKVKEGGLGIPALETTIPTLRKNRLLALRSSTWDVARALLDVEFVKRQLDWCDRQLSEEQRRSSFHKTRLHGSVDGVELKQAAECSASTRWVAQSAEGIPGRDYVHYHAVRINALPTRVRTSRGRPAMDRSCRACAAPAETLAHVVQVCPRTHGGRVKRHDAVTRTVAGSLSNKGWSVECEKTYRLPGGIVLRPDLVATRPDGEKVFILDMQVVSGSSNLRAAHEAKIRKYDRVDLKSAVASQRGIEVGRVEVAAATLSWRGIWHGKSAESLRAMGVPLGVLNGVTTRVILGSYLNWWGFSTSTSNFRKCQRGGVG
ncbi:Reverse transcriptase (RNA-dependent DNA polymerase) [Nesidiocoris tenuis]|nr:Reverse transcriptase (RNA-dependent DNA polymerase) [Nesidiocoris tenuis]